MNKLKCFIACAFGKDDIEKLYKKAIIKVLFDLKIEPLRVDKVEHNENIDLKIIDLINASDFCIADLTYARPSVYYEAGYFSGLNKPVIYIVRKDHFTAKINDPYGNLKVHFDLQMKNIIDWTSTKKIKTFKKRLESRIKYVCKPLMKQKDSDEKLKKERQIFFLTPVIKRIEEIKRNSEILMINKKWIPLYNKYSLKKIDQFIYKKKKYILKIKILNTITLNYLRQEWRQLFLQETNLESKSNYINILALISLRKVPPKRIEDAYPSASQVEYGKIIKIENNCYILFIHGFESLDEFISEFERQIELICN